MDFETEKVHLLLPVLLEEVPVKAKCFMLPLIPTTYGDQVIIYANVYEANGQSAPYSPRAVVKLETLCGTQ